MSHDQEHEADVEAHREGYLRGNDYALPYYSPFSKEHSDDAAMLRHMSCCYESSRAAPPTLLALKQHAQSLCYLITLLEPAEHPLQVGGKGGGKGSGKATTSYASAWDWLFDMQTPYTNDDPDHHRPLVDLMNQVASRHDVTGTKYRCALEEHKPSSKDAPRRPYASHANLLMHANECLERLDHEYSTSGGLLSVLPTNEDYDGPDLRAARNSLVGQWLMFTQQLVGRMHELEIAYGNALDALASEAVAPLQSLGGGGGSLHGPDARSGREIAYPQDRWVLVNAGDDIFDHLHQLLDRAEALAEEKEKVWRGEGHVIGERYWTEQRGGKTYARGIIPLNITTRYYRLKGQGRSTIFVCPAWDEHPAVAATKALESRPTVVAVTAPRFPARATDLERRFTEQIDRAAEIEIENVKLLEATQRKDREIRLLRDRNRYEAGRNEVLYATLADVQDKSAAQIAEEKHALQRELAELKDSNHKALSQARAELDIARARLRKMSTAYEKLEAANKKLGGAQERR